MSPTFNFGLNLFKISFKTSLFIQTIPWCFPCADWNPRRVISAHNFANLTRSSYYGGILKQPNCFSARNLAIWFTIPPLYMSHDGLVKYSHTTILGRESPCFPTTLPLIPTAPLVLPSHSHMIPVHRTSPTRDLLQQLFDFRHGGVKYDAGINALRTHCQSFGGILPHNEMTATLWTAVPSIIVQRSRLSYEDDSILNLPPSMDLIVPPSPTFDVPFNPLIEERYIISPHTPRSPLCTPATNTEASDFTESCMPLIQPPVSPSPTDTEASDFTESCIPPTEPPVSPSPTRSIIPSSISPPTSSTIVADGASSTSINNTESEGSYQSTDNLPNPVHDYLVSECSELLVNHHDLESAVPSVGSDVRLPMLMVFRTVWPVCALPYRTCSSLSVFVYRRREILLISTQRSTWPLAWVGSTPLAYSHRVICNVAWMFSSPTPMDPFPCSPWTL